MIRRQFTDSFMPEDKINQAIEDLDEYLGTQPIELAGHARVYEMFAYCLGICAEYELKPEHLACRFGDEADTRKSASSTR